MCCQSSIYRHVGIELKLYSFKKYALSRVDDSGAYLRTFLRDWKNQVRNAFSVVLTVPLLLCCCCCGRHNEFLRYHGCREYMERLLAHETNLVGKKLDHVYTTAKLGASM